MNIFDTQFNKFVTTSSIRVFYGLTLAVIGLGLLGSEFSACDALTRANRGGEGGVAFLYVIGSPVVALLCVLLLRISCEMLIVVFRISEHLAEINGKMAGNVPVQPGVVTGNPATTGTGGAGHEVPTKKGMSSGKIAALAVLAAMIFVVLIAPMIMRFMTAP